MTAPTPPAGPLHRLPTAPGLLPLLARHRPIPRSSQRIISAAASEPARFADPAPAPSPQESGGARRLTRQAPRLAPHRWAWLLVALLALFALAPLTYPGYFQTQSGFLPTLIAAAPDRAPDAWLRYAGDGRLAYWLVWPLYRLSGSSVVAVKWGYGLAILLAAWGAYLWTRRWLGARGAILAALVYTYLPWHLSAVYIRGSLSEAWLWALWPLTLWAIDALAALAPSVDGTCSGSQSQRPAEAQRGDNGVPNLFGHILHTGSQSQGPADPPRPSHWIQTALGALTAALLTLAGFGLHPGLAALFLLLATAYALSLTLPRLRPAHAAVAAAAALLLAALVLWLTARLPALDLPVNGSFLYPYQLLSAAWGPVGAGSTVGDLPGWSRAYPVSYQVGLAAVCLTLVAAALWAARRRRRYDPARELTPPQPGLTSAPPSVSLPDTPNLQPTPSPHPAPAPATLSPGRDPASAEPPLPFARPFLFWLAALLLLLFLTLHPSALLWRLTGLDALPLHPWHLLALDGLPLAFLAGSMVRLDRRLAQPAAWAGLLALVILASYPYLAPRFLQVDPGLQPLALLQPRGAASPQIMVLAAETSEQAVPPAEITPTLTLTLTWQALAPVEADYTVFVHLLAPDGQKVAQRDVQPCNGDCPTSAWEPGDVVVDRYTLELPVPEPAAPYRLAVGLYLLATGDRVPVAGRDAESRWRSGDGAFYLEVP